METLHGIGVSSGVAVGRVYLLHAEPLPVVPDPIPPERVEEEIERFHRARRTAGEEIEALRVQVTRALDERYAGIFEAQKLVLEDPILVRETVQRIRVGRISARWALKEVVAEFLHRFEAVEDEYIRERGGELSDVQSRLQRLLRGESARAHTLPEGPLVVVAHTVDPSDAVLLASAAVVGLAADAGSRTSHTAILAQALGLPAVAGLHDFSRRVAAGDTVLVDGDSGEVVLDPPAEATERAEQRRAAALVAESEMAALPHPAVVTRDGVEVTIRANIEFPSEVDRALSFGAQGIGLYRSEFLFLSRSPSLPDEEEHFRTYVEIAEKVQPHPAVIRTLDLGGEKYFHRVLSRNEPNPVLGLRGVRLSLRHPEIFRPQIRGLLRAAAVQDNISFMLPVVTVVEEVRQVRRIVAEEVASLKAVGRQVRADVPLGIMIEVPAAALTAASLAREVSFFSIGTNDLTQYALAVDRSNEWLEALCEPLNPGLLELIRLTVEAARTADIPVAICGEMAADPRTLGVLVGLGLRELSIHPRAVGRIRQAVRELDSVEAQSAARQALAGSARENTRKGS